MTLTDCSWYGGDSEGLHSAQVTVMDQKNYSPSAVYFGNLKIIIYHLCYSLPTLYPLFASGSVITWDSSGSLFRSLTVEGTKSISRMAPGP